MSEQETKPSVEVKAKSTIKFGKLRQRVKSGELDPAEVLMWYKKQEWQHSKSLFTFLKNQIKKRRVARQKKAEEKEKPKKKQKADDKQKGRKPRRRKRTKTEDKQ